MCHAFNAAKLLSTPPVYIFDTDAGAWLKSLPVAQALTSVLAIAVLRTTATSARAQELKERAGAHAGGIRNDPSSSAFFFASSRSCLSDEAPSFPSIRATCSRLSCMGFVDWMTLRTWSRVKKRASAGGAKRG